MLREPEQLDNLMRQRNSHEDLAAAQLKALLLRQKQLQGLEERLKRMEGQKYQNDNPNDSVLAQKQKQLEEFEKKLSMLENSFSSPIDQQEGEIGSITTDNYANNLMTNFPADLQVQRQTLEKLSYLEDQLVQLKELKAQMLQGAEIMERRHMEVKYSNDLEEPKSNRDQVIQMPFDAKDQIEIVDFNQRTSTSKPQDQSNQSLGRSELEVATEAMLGYLNMKEKAETDPVDENAVLQQLMERLMSASVEEKDLVSSQPIQGVYNDELEEDHEDQIQDQMNENQNENNEEENDEEQHEYERLLDEDKEEDDFDGPLKGEDAMSEILATSQRIDTAIDGLGHQINQVKQSESLITTEKEREYFMDVLGKLQTQMDELIEIRSKINYYKELMDQNQQVCSLLI